MLKMKTEKHFSRILFSLLVFYLIAHAVSQYCSEFVSPQTILTYGSRVGTIQIPTSGNIYESNQVCQWTLETDSAGYGIQLDVTECSLEGKDIHGECNSDYVDVFDSVNDDVVLIDRFCGVDQGKSYKSSGNKMIIQFQSNDVLEFSGFQASYQSVFIDSDHESEEKMILGLAVGISVGVLVIVVVVVITVYLIRRNRQKTAAGRMNSQASAQNNNFPNIGLPGGSPTSDLPYCVSRCDMYSNTHVDGGGDLDPHFRNLPAQAVIPGCFHEDSRSIRSNTPPPAYDSLNFVEVGQNHMSLSPPPYEMVVKYGIDSSNA